MVNKILDDIKEYAQKLLIENYGYCGLADGDHFAMLNSDDGDGKDILITIKDKDE